MVAYKLFKLRKNNTLGSLFINAGAILPFNKWMHAKAYRTKGFAFRPGWHSTHKPIAPHLSMKNRVWAKVEIRNYKTQIRPKNQGGKWYLSKWIKIDKILLDKSSNRGNMST